MGAMFIGSDSMGDKNAMKIQEGENGGSLAKIAYSESGTLA